MKFKTVILITLLLAIFTISAVSAADENATDEVISIENNNAATYTIDLDEKSTEYATDNERKSLNAQKKTNIINSIKNSGLTNEAEDSGEPSCAAASDSLKHKYLIGYPCSRNMLS